VFPKIVILIGCSITNHPFWGTAIFGNTQMLQGLRGEAPSQEHLFVAALFLRSATKGLTGLRKCLPTVAKTTFKTKAPQVT